MKVGIFINTTKNDASVAADEFSKLLAKNGVETRVVNLPDDCTGLDAIAVFGGDGTILRVVDFAIDYDLPVLAVNVGTVGFLSSVDRSDLNSAVELVLNGKINDKRAVIRVTAGDKKFYALNEASVQRDTDGVSIAEAIKLRLNVDKKFVDDIMCDGLIIATPTGSTAYSLSAGGAILTPNLPALIATPICPHSFRIRPIVFGDDLTAEIEVLAGSGKCALFVDGRKIKTIRAGEKVTVQKSKRYVRFYKADNDFFERLTTKLNTWSVRK
mgnify:FL=1